MRRLIARTALTFAVILGSLGAATAAQAEPGDGCFGYNTHVCMYKERNYINLFAFITVNDLQPGVCIELSTSNKNVMSSAYNSVSGYRLYLYNMAQGGSSPCAGQNIETFLYPNSSLSFGTSLNDQVDAYAMIPSP